MIAIPFSSSEVYLTSIVRYCMVSIPLYFIVYYLSQSSKYYKIFIIGLFIILNIFIAHGNDYYFIV